MERWAASRARAQMAELFNRVAYGGVRVVLHRRGRDLVAVISMGDFARLTECEGDSGSSGRRVVRRVGRAARRSR